MRRLAIKGLWILFAASLVGQAQAYRQVMIHDPATSRLTALGINDHGEIIGSAHSGKFIFRPFMDNDGGVLWNVDADEDGINDLLLFLDPGEVTLEERPNESLRTYCRNTSGPCIWDGLSRSVVQSISTAGYSVAPYPKLTNGGRLAGSRVVSDPSTGQASYFEAATWNGTWTSHGALPGWDYGSKATAVNDNGWAAGSAYKYADPSNPDPTRLVSTGIVIRDGNIEEIGTLGGTDSRGNEQTYVMGMNIHGQVVGWSYADDGDPLARDPKKIFIWLPARAYGMKAGMHELEMRFDFRNFPGRNVLTINDKGQIAGTMSGDEVFDSNGNSGGFLPTGFLWLPEADYGMSDGLYDTYWLGSGLGLNYFKIYDLNNSGVMVGNTWDGDKYDVGLLVPSVYEPPPPREGDGFMETYLEVHPKSPDVFEFTVFNSSGQEANSFSLNDDNGADGGTHNNFKRYISVPAGTYRVDQTQLEGYRTEIVCDDLDGGSQPLSDRSASFDIDAGETVRCTFRNKRGITYVALGDSYASGEGAGDYTDSNQLGILGYMLGDVSAPPTAVSAPLVTESSSPEPSTLTTPAEEMAQIRAVALRDGSVRVIVGFDAPARPPGPYTRVDDAARRDELQAIGRGVLGKMGGTGMELIHQFKYVPFFVMSIDAAAFDRLTGLPEVINVSEDTLQPPSLSSSNPVIASPTVWREGYRGTGQVVAVLDTGIDSTHSWFVGPAPTGHKIVAEACFSSTDGNSQAICPSGSTGRGTGQGAPCDSSISGCDHGTHVAGIVAGNNGVGPAFGVAPEASLISVQVFSSNSSATDCGPVQAPCALSFTSDQARGLEWVYEVRDEFNIAAVNISIGSEEFVGYCDNHTARLTNMKGHIDNLRAIGIPTIISAGNNGFRDAINSPACISSAIRVAATTNLDALAEFSNVSRLVELAAPGSAIVSAVPGGGTAVKSGTSMAAPHVAGAWALLKQADSDASVDEILNALRLFSTRIDDERIGGWASDIRRINLGQNMCHRSKNAWSQEMPGGVEIAQILVDEPEVYRSFGACSGAVIIDLTERNVENNERPQLETPKLDNADLVTLSIGGNDALFAYILKKCGMTGGLIGGPTCEDSSFIPPGASESLRIMVNRKLTWLETSGLPFAYERAKQAAPDAELVVMGYPYVISNNPTHSSCLDSVTQPFFQQSEKDWFTELTDAINGIIQNAASAAGAHYVDMRPHFAGREVCALGGNKNEWIHGFTWGRVLSKYAKQEMFHPNLWGQLAYSNAVDQTLTAIGFPDSLSESRRMSPGAALAAAAPAAVFSDPPISIGPLRVTALVPGCGFVSTGFAPGQEVRLQGTGFAASSSVQLWFSHSGTAAMLTTVSADSNGVLDADVQIPVDATVGVLAMLEATGETAGGGQRLLHHEFQVEASSSADQDEDGVPDVCDSCRDTPNADQLDVDGDGFGNACDVCPNDGLDDIDGDGLCADADICPFDANNVQTGEGLCIGPPPWIFGDSFE